MKSSTEVAEARVGLEPVTDEQMTRPWSLLEAGETLFILPRATRIRGFLINHIIHHRAILCVYHSMNDIPVPGLYGPSGDE